MLKTSRACNSFSPDVFSLSDTVNEKGAFQALSSLVKTVKTPQLKLMAAALMFEGTTRKYGFNLGQVVYIRYRGSLSADYMSNFMIAYVLAATSKHIKFMGLSSLTTLTYLREGSNTEGPSIYSKNSFEKLRAKMLDKVDGDPSESIDPAIDKLHRRRLRNIEDVNLNAADSSRKGYIATIDDVMADNGISDSSEENEDGSLVDLVSIARDIEKGFDVQKTSERYKTPKKSTSTVGIRTTKKGGDSVIEFV